MKKLLFTTIIVLFVAISATAQSGTTGNLTWNFDTATGTLTISGTGATPEYLSSYDAPWDSFRSSVRQVVVSEGVTTIGYAAFYDCSNLTSVTIPESVIGIGMHAFRNCSSLTSVIIPEGVIRILHYAFQNCSSLTSVTIPESVTTIGQAAFYGCAALKTLNYNAKNCNDISYPISWTEITSLILGENVESIPNGAFSGCTNLTSITIPESITTIGSGAFESTAWYNNQPDGVLYISKVLYRYKGTMPANTTISITEGTKGIGNSAFSDCSNLTSVTIPESVTTIGDGAFYRCSSLASVTIPEGVTSIGEYTFSGCSNLISIIIPESVTIIGYNAFSDCSNLTSITIPESITTIGNGAFESTAWYNSQPNGVLYISKVLYRYKGTMPANTIINVAEGTVMIGDRAFYGCSNLTSVTIPEGVTSIGGYAFSNCGSLTSITIPESVTFIQGGTFIGCTELTSFVWDALPDAIYVTSSYDNCNKLEIVSGPATVLNIQNISNYPANLKSVRITGGELTAVHFNVFRQSYRTITVLDMAGAINTEIPDDQFVDFRALREVVLPSATERIGYKAFAECVNIESITLPEALTEIGARAFENCYKMTDIIWGTADKLTTIGDRAFFNCHSLKDIELPEGVTEVGIAAFMGCAYLTDLVLPSSINRLSDQSFANASNLTSMTVNATMPPAISAHTFFAVKRSIPVYVPEESVELYKSNLLWGEFNIQGKDLAGNINNTLEGVKVFAQNGEIVITGIEQPQVSVFDLNGRMIMSGKTNRIAVPQAGVYIVKIGTETVKVVL